MPPFPHEQLRSSADLPNYELLRKTGWAVNAVVGRYCVAFRGPEEVVMMWRDGEWKLVANRQAGPPA